MIRPYRLSDRSALIEIFRLNTPRWFFPHEQKDLEEFLDTHGGTYFVAEHDGKVVGCGGYRVVEPATGRISWYMFHPDFQGKGLGSKQVEHALALLRGMPGLEKIEVSTSQLQYQFYEKFGFVTVETKADFWGPGMDLVRMEMAPSVIDLKQDNMEHPLVVRVAIPQTVFNPDAVDTEIFCVNVTRQTFSVSAKSESFTTVDEEEGTAVAHGSQPATVLLGPGDSARVADVKGWEWDGHVGISLVFREESSGHITTKSYDLKSGKADFTLPSGETGRVIPALR